jgi:pilus assembly protein FimV
MMSLNLRLFGSALLLAPAAALALGLGEIRLNSSLNEPLTAEIDLVAATPEELASLQAQLASVEVFQRYGLDRPAYLNSLEFAVVQGRQGRSVLRVRSTDAISEPFVSFLVDVTWPRGRLLREYTVLLDPPVLAAPAPGRAAASVSAPAASPARSQAPASAPAPTPASASAPSAQPAAPESAPAAVAETPAVAAGDGSHHVQRGDTLFGIASSISGGDRPAIERTMIGLFRANPAAFDGNINQLHAGAILRVPPSEELAGISANEAASEVRRHTAEWRGAGGGEDSGRLRLVTPEEGVADSGTGETEAGTPIESQIEALERDIAEQRRMLELRNQELAKLQQDLAASRAAEAADAAAAKAAADAAAAGQVGEDSAVAPEDDVARPKTPPVVAAPKPKAAAAPAEPDQSFLERLTDSWMILAGALAVVMLGLLGYGYMRRRNEADVEVALKSFELPATAPIPTETMRLRALATGDATAEMERPRAMDDEFEDIVVEERPIARPKPEAPRPSKPPDETISAEAAIDLDQADPLAEADFHMAYGLYDQAVDLVRMALRNSPDRNDLKLKLAEIHFVAGDTQQFLTVARDLRKTLGPGGDWDRMVIMGRQLAPDEPMFAGGVQDAGVDLSLEGGDNLVDLDLLSAPEGDEGLDLDLGKVAAASDSSDPTGENDALEFNLDEGPTSFSTTQKISPRESPRTVEMPTLELPTSETPTVETPGMKTVEKTVERPTMKMGARQPARERANVPTDSTAEMAIDDLGFDLGNLDDVSDQVDETASVTGVHEDLTQVAPHDDSTQLRARTENGGGDDDGTAAMPGDRGGATAVLPPIDFGEIDLDVGAAAEDSDSESTVRDRMAATEQMQMPKWSQLEPVTMSEVGTKLDLARAYMDMGDPDGARNILQEVLAEGSASQKQEARRLIDTLPGA